MFHLIYQPKRQRKTRQRNNFISNHNELNQDLIFIGGSMKYLINLILLSFLLVLVACNEKESSPTAPASTEISFANSIQPIFNNNCVGCHSPGGPAQFLDLSSGVSYANLVNQPSAQDSTWLLVDPSDDSKSLLYQKMKGSATVGPNTSMPPAGVLANDVVDKVEQWINEGAKDN